MPIDPRKRHRPLSIGSSISRVPAHEDDRPEVGTLGAFIEDEDGKRYILSNCHIMAENPYQLTMKTRIMQPAWSEPDADNNKDQVATVVAYTLIDKNGLNIADAALALIDDDVEVDPVHSAFGKLAGVKDCGKGDRVRMLSRTQGLHFADVADVKQTAQVKFTGGFDVKFTNQALLTTETLGGPSRKGDSGGMWVTEDGYGCLLNFSGANYLDDDSMSLKLHSTVKILEKPKKVEIFAYDEENNPIGTMELETTQEITMAKAEGNATPMSVVMEWAEKALKKKCRLMK